jgi:Flp pilus assembly protein TadB
VGAHDRDDWQERYEASLREDERRRGVVEEGFWENPATRYMLTSGAFFIVTFAIGFIVTGLWWVVAFALVFVAVIGAVFVAQRRRRRDDGVEG